MKNKLLKITASMLGCLTVISIGNHCYNTQANNLNTSVNTEEPIIFTEVSSYDTKYNFADSKVLSEFSDLVVIGKITDIGTPTNFNPTTKKYGKARTPGNLEVLQVIKGEDKKVTDIEFMDAGGLISYDDYEKSLLPAQKAKREYLMSQNGVNLQAKSNMFVKQSVKGQLELEEEKTYIMYLKYNEDFDKYMVVSQPYGIKEYNVNTGKILNHVTNEVENLSEIM